jgi:hypothetical protein
MISNNPSSDKSKSVAIKILLADSDSLRVKKVLSCIEQKNNYPGIRVCQYYIDLMPMLDGEIPDLLLLGTFSASNCFDVAQECRKYHKDLQIFLLSNQISIEQDFGKFAINKGLTGIITSDLSELNVIIENLQQKLLVTAEVDSITTLTVQAMSIAIQEIAQVGSTRFGALVQGHYWRKSQALALREFPTLQNWSVNHFGIISYNEVIERSQLTNEDIQGVKRWIGLYISECERSVEDFKVILKSSNLSLFTIQLLPEFY